MRVETSQHVLSLQVKPDGGYATCVTVCSMWTGLVWFKYSLMADVSQPLKNSD